MRVIGPLLLGACIALSASNLFAVQPALAKVLGEPRPVVDPQAWLRQTVYVLDSENGQGSGVMIEKGRMLTAAHVVDGDEKVVLIGSQKIKTKILKIDTEKDIALLEVEIGCPCVPVMKNATVQGMKAVLVGYPLFNQIGLQILNEGVVQGEGGVMNRLTISGHIAPGMSGGGVFVWDENWWRLSGIISSVPGVRTTGPIMSITRAVSTKDIHDFLNE